jgi:LmbE family N-acetylglucosaminyl deacetylase
MRILIIGAHPDDETFSMGGTLARHIAAGDEVFVLILADGITARNGDPDEQRKCFDKAMQLYGVTHCNLLGLPDQQLDTIHTLELVKIVEENIAGWKPERVYFHTESDIGQDHRKIHEVCLLATKPKLDSPIKSVLCFPSPTSTWWGTNHPFVPNYFVDITQYIDVKIAVMRQAYPGETPPAPHPRSVISIKNRAQMVASFNGIDGYCEEFKIVRQIIK